MTTIPSFNVQRVERQIVSMFLTIKKREISPYQNAPFKSIC